MIKAFVFGKFLPFHKGHEAMINFALTKCDFLAVLVCCSDKENITAMTRQKWIEKTFENQSKIEIKSFHQHSVLKSQYYTRAARARTSAS